MSQIKMNDRRADYRTPRWVKILGVVVLVLVLLIGFMIFADKGGEHGPGRHSPAQDTIEEHTAPFDHDRQQP